MDELETKVKQKMLPQTISRPSKLQQSLLDHFSIGFELEANVIHAKTGAPRVNFNNENIFTQLEDYLLQQGCCALQTEFDSATLEFTTQPAHHIDTAFQSLRTTLAHANKFLQTKDYLLLLMGLHPGRALNSLIMTNKCRCHDSIPLMADSGGPLFYTSFQINIALPTQYETLLFPLCQVLQHYMWPCSVITQASAIFTNRYTQYQCYRPCLNQAVSASRAGPLPKEILNWEMFQHYCAQLPDEQMSARKNNVWFDIFPKYLNSNDPKQGSRIEIRLADTTDLTKLYHFTQAIVLTYFALLEKLLTDQPIPTPENIWFLLNRDYILKKGRQAQLTFDGKNFLAHAAFLTEQWQPMLADWFTHLAIQPETLIAQLCAVTRAESILAQFSKNNGNDIAVAFAQQDAKSLASNIV